MTSPLLSRLWTHARAALDRLRATIPPLHVLTARETRQLRAWLHELEAFVRRVVLIEAMNLAPALALAPALPLAPALACAAPTPTARVPHRSKSPPRLRLWPRPRPGPRMRLLGAPTLVAEIWRERQRQARLAQLTAARARRKSLALRFADRIDALDRLLQAPLRAARRLARKLRRAPRLAIALCSARRPRLYHLDAELVREAEFESAAKTWPDSS